MRRLLLSLVLCGLVAQADGAAAAAPAAIRYEIALDDRRPQLAEMAMAVPAGSPVLTVAPAGEASLARAPSCDGRTLTRRDPGGWHIPGGCRRITWSAAIKPIDAAKFDVAAPESVWIPETRLWLLTRTLPWLGFGGQTAASVDIRARAGRRTIRQTMSLPPADVPLAIVVGRPVRTFTANGFSVRGYGLLPPTAADGWQGQLAGILAAWRRDLLPVPSDAAASLNYVWLPSAAGADPGLQASSNSGSILMQLAADPRDGPAGPRLQVGLVMIGAHEGFHALGNVRGGPAWVNESLATYFAFRAARPHLAPAALGIAERFVNAEEKRSLLNLQRAFEQGDGSAYASFYGKGARFWSAIEQVLAVPANDSGRLAALIRQTNGLEGIDWSDGERIAAFLDRYSDGRAAAVVRCYVILDDCPSADVGKI